ncbi:MAG: hypothetical protein GY950_25715 [bacterium]|nr:hypothetical protein [bacterium]
MEIIIFKDGETLGRYIESQGRPVPVLEITGSGAPPVAFTQTEKERILDEYVEAVSEAGALNDFSLAWLCHPISEKNDLVPDNLLDRLIDFLSFQRFLATSGGETVAVLTQRASLIQNILDFAAATGMGCRLEVEEESKAGTLRGLGRPVKRMFQLVKGALQCHSRFMKSRFLWKRVDRNRVYTVIRTWIDSRSRSLMEKDRDIYFGKLPGFLKENGHNVLYFGEFIYGFDHEFGNIKSGLSDPVILGRSLLNGLDFVKAFRFQYSAHRRLKLPVGVKILDTDVDIVFNNYFHAFARDPMIRANYLTYRETAKLMKRIKVDYFYMPYENYSWEKLTRSAIWEQDKKVKVTSFQHAQVALNATKFFMGKKEIAASIFPQRVVTLGEVTRNVLIKQKHYPENRVVTGCALRQDYTVTGERVTRTKHRRVLVQLWSVKKSARLIGFIHTAGIHPDRFQVSLNLHPCNPLEKLIPHMDFKYENNFPLAVGALEKNFEAHDIVIFHGTTTCLDALANGLPVINVEFDDFISVDPLIGFDDFKWTVRAPGELGGVIETIYGLSDENYYKRQEKGFKFVKDYFHPVNEENLKKFLL